MKTQTCVVCEVRPAQLPPMIAICTECVERGDRMAEQIQREIDAENRAGIPQPLRIEQMPNQRRL